MINAVAQAYAEKSAVVVISGAPGLAEGHGGLALHHQVKTLDSQHLIYREVTAAQALLNDAADAPAEIARVLTIAREHSRPVYIELPRDMVAADCAPVPAYAETPHDPEAAAAAAAEVVARIAAAQRPALMLGVEVRRYGLEAKVAELARRLAIPTVTSFMARGILAGEAVPPVGTYLGLAGDEHVRGVVEGSDCLLMFGVIVSDTNFAVSERMIDRRRAVHAFDREVRFGHHLYPNVPLEALVDALLRLAPPAWAALVPAASAPHPVRESPPLAADDAPIAPSDIAAAVNDLIREGGERYPIAADIGDCLFTAMDMAYTELVAPAYYATMGPGVPMGIGLAVASGRRPLILVGDGAFQMTGWELGNCRRLGVKPIVLVFNNRAWGMLKVFQADTSYNDLDDWRFAEFAPLLGGRGRRVTKRRELREALAEAHADKANWHLIEIMLPRDVYSPTLSRFVSAVKRQSVLGKS
jgi:indolepyruvate decarboxylase